MDKATNTTFADLLINLSAGWIAAAYGVIFLAEEGLLIKILLLTGDVSFATLCLLTAIWLRKKNKI